ncbi:hypothetical protein, partial [Eubacterium aggregans]|uniref:hypothetical protein n=1 Tax=Eubacterium aggregans TaxID=81409 RepID=UPI0023F22104
FLLEIPHDPRIHVNGVRYLFKHIGVAGVLQDQSGDLRQLDHTHITALEIIPFPRLHLLCAHR